MKFSQSFRRLIIFFFVALSVLLSSSTEAASPSPPVELKFSYGASLDLQGMYYPYELSPQVNQYLGIANIEGNSSLKVGKQLLFKFRPTAHLDPENKSESEQYWVELPEGYGQYKHSLGDMGTFYGQLGFNTFTWGVTDGFNPVDVVSPRRYNDPLHSEKLGVFAAVAKVDFGGALVEGIFIPYQRQSVLPDVNSRWLPREIEREQVNKGVLFRFPANHTYYFQNEQVIDDALKYNGGVRVASHLFGADLAAYVFNGAAPVPATNTTVIAEVTNVTPGTRTVIDANPAIGLLPIFYRQTVVGASAVMPVWELLVRVEGAYSKPMTKAQNLPGDTKEAVLELEHTFSGEKSSLTVIALATYADHVEFGAVNSNTSLSRLFDRGLAFGLRWQPISTFSADTFAAFDTKHGGQLFQLNGTLTLNDAWKVYASTEQFMGTINTPIGAYRKNDRYMAGLKVAL